MFRGEPDDDHTTYIVKDHGVGLGGDSDLDVTTH